MTRTTEQNDSYWTDAPAAPAVGDNDRRRFRARALAVAAAFTSGKDSAEAVTANAGPLVAWLEAATDAADLRARYRAMDEHHYNTAAARPVDNPEGFLVQARTLYEFITADRPAAAA